MMPRKKKDYDVMLEYLATGHWPAMHSGPG